MVATPVRRKRGAASRSRAKPRAEKRREREQALRDELALAERNLDEAKQSVQEAERERAKAEQVVASVRAKLERL